MTTRILNINEVNVSQDPVVYVCYGLGSCIGLFLMDRQLGIVGGAHIPLADEYPSGTYSSAKSMIDQMLAAFSTLGSDLKALRAKITGGALVFESSMDIGTRNAEAVIQNLVCRKVFIAATDIGGRFSRRAVFRSDTENVQVSTSEKRIYTI